MTAMTGAPAPQDLAVQRARALRTALVLGAVALAVFAGFLFVNIVVK